jgi:hypothetical protein
MKKKMEPRLGIDIGRVIISAGEGGADTSFLSGTLEDALETPPMPLAFEQIAQLVKAFEGRVWLVSKCGPKVQERTKKWLTKHRFYDATGVSQANLRFCLKRPQKADHARQLRLTHFIDDRVDVLEHLRPLVPKLFLFGPQKGSVDLDWLEHLPSWEGASERVTAE